MVWGGILSNASVRRVGARCPTAPTPHGSQAAPQQGRTPARLRTSKAASQQADWPAKQLLRHEGSQAGADRLVNLCGPQHDDTKGDVLLLINSFCDLWLAIFIGNMWVMLSIVASVS